ncbi:hypothetical protein [Sulfurovum sp.]|uniref:hypothetical protein n=1 Tax=Sulfurovum sp. TaxID=1969726 RepID=UPI00286835B1|nr:hypothetical protein [Sulfurovum sp.]
MEVTKPQVINPMWGFILRYAFWASLLYAAIYFENFSPLIFINTLQTDLSIYLTQLWIAFFDMPIQMSGATLIYEHGLQLEIVNECNGLAAFLFFLAGVLAYPTPMKVKLIWIILAYFVLLIANTIRLDWILYHVIEHPEDFDFIHEVVGRYVIAAIPLVLFYFYSDRYTKVESD